LLIAAGALLAFLVGLRPHLASLQPVEEEMSFYKGCIALLALALSLSETFARRRGYAISERAVRWIAGLLAAAAMFAYFNSEQPHGYTYHLWDMFHYYLGSKYHAELGYKRIYRCTAVAESELSPASLTEVRGRGLRNLETNSIETTAAALAEPAACKLHFSAERWAAFKKDVAFFRGQSDRAFWVRVQTDHGYNTPPLWTAMGKMLAVVFPVSTPGLTALACIDPILFIGMFFAIFRAFGFRVMCVAIIFWGTQFPAHEFFTNGAMLRKDWLFLTVVSACLARRRCYFLAGGALMAASLLRVFPAVLFAGWIVHAAAHALHHRRLPRPYARTFAGAAVIGATLACVSAAVVGPDAYGEFIAHIRAHQQVPLTNNMGLPQIVSFSTEGRAQWTRDYGLVDPYSKWASAQIETRHRRHAIWAGIVCVVAVAFVVLVARLKTMWVTQALSLVLLVSATPLACYYYDVFILAALLSAIHKRFERAALLVAGTSAMLIRWPRLSYWWDDRYVVQSVLFFGFAVGLLLSFKKRHARREA
jgi:hypothetical protein